MHHNYAVPGQSAFHHSDEWLTQHTLLPQTKVLPPTREGSNLTLAGGVAHRVVDDSANGLAGSTLTAPPAGGQLSNVALFIDQNSQQLDSVAEVKFWGWGLGCVRTASRLT